MGKRGSSASKTFPDTSEKVTSKGDLMTNTSTAPAVIFTSFCPSRIWTRLLASGKGAPARAHEKSLGKCPLGATRTRIMPLETRVIRTLALPAVSSAPSWMPSLNTSTRSTLPMCCQPWASIPVLPIAQSSIPVPSRRTSSLMSILLMVSKGCRLHAVEGFTKNLRRSPVVSSGKPLLEKRRRFRSFHPSPYSIHHATVDRTVALIETKPIRQVELAWDSGDFYPRITQLEESLLEDHTQDFFSQQPGSALLGQCRPEQIAAVAG